MLMPCPECGTPVSDLARSCAACGFPLRRRPSKGLSSFPLPSAAASRRVLVFVLACAACFAVWAACVFVMLAIIGTGRRDAQMVYRPVLSFVCVFASRIWIGAAARLWPERGGEVAKRWFSAGFLFMTFADLAVLPDLALFLVCLAARMAGYCATIASLERLLRRPSKKS